VAGHKKSEPTAATHLGQDSIRSQGLANPVTMMASTRKELLKQQLRNLRRTTVQNSCQNTDSHWHRNKYRCDSHRNTHPNNTYRQPAVQVLAVGMEWALVEWALEWLLEWVLEWVLEVLEVLGHRMLGLGPAQPIQRQSNSRLCSWILANRHRSPRNHNHSQEPNQPTQKNR